MNLIEILKMSYEIIFKENNMQLWVVYSGTIKIDEIAESWEQRTSNVERFKEVRFIIADYSQASLKLITEDDVKKGSKWPKKAAMINPNITLIALQPHDLEYGLGRMWATYSDTGEYPWKFINIKSHDELNKILSE